MKIKYRLDFTPDWVEWSRRKFSAAQEKTLEMLGQFWFRNLLQKHFTNAAMREYGYQPRTAKYARYKAAKEHRTEPLVGISRKGHRAGTLKAMALSAARVKASPKKLVVAFSVPAYAYKRGRHGTGPDKIRELTEISDREKTELLGLYGEHMREQLEHEPRRAPKPVNEG